MRRFPLLCAIAALSLNAQTVKIVVQNPILLKELQAGAEFSITGSTGNRLGQ